MAANLAGLLGLSLPCYFDNNNLLIAVQLIGNVKRRSLFEVAYVMSNRLRGINAQLS